MPNTGPLAIKWDDYCSVCTRDDIFNHSELKGDDCVCPLSISGAVLSPLLQHFQNKAYWLFEGQMVMVWLDLGPKTTWLGLGPKTTQLG